MSQDVTQLGRYDVVVAGAGLAGIAAALAAADAGARTAIVSAGPLFSGSSFYEGTWGLGLVGPEDAADVDEFVGTILKVGRGMANPTLVRALAEGVPGAVESLEALGYKLRRPERAAEREFIPCFDHKARLWRGIERDSARRALGAALERAHVDFFSSLELVDLRISQNQPCPPVEQNDVCPDGDGSRTREGMVESGALVLATGGFGGLFGRTLTRPDVLGTAQALALRAGAALVNCEFMQIMPGLVSPVEGAVFNEKAFRFARAEGAGLEDGLMAERAEHGPFTSGRADRAVDMAVAACGAAGAPVAFDLPELLPELVQTYESWFCGAYGASPWEGVRIAPYAHASNGGILIDEHGATGVPGLFACGECAGGMHGADRIGGLASASALVFGRAAGRAAAEHATSSGANAPVAAVVVSTGAAADAATAATLTGLRRTMDARCLLPRTESGLIEAQDTIADLRKRATGARARLALASADALVAAMLARRESRGGHFRADFPAEDPVQARPIAVRLRNGRAVAEPLFK